MDGIENENILFFTNKSCHFMEQNQQKQIIKLIILGDPRVGKSQITNYFALGKPVLNQLSTIGVVFRAKTIVIDDREYTIQIWDTAGQERFRAITKSYIRGAQGIFVVYDVSQLSSFDNIPQWISSITENVNTDIVPVILIGNKCDLRHVVSDEVAKDLAASYNIPFMETSAIQGNNIDKAFETLARLVVKNYSIPQPTPVPDTNPSGKCKC